MKIQSIDLRSMGGVPFTPVSEAGIASMLSQLPYHITGAFAEIYCLSCPNDCSFYMSTPFVIHDIFLKGKIDRNLN